MATDQRILDAIADGAIDTAVNARLGDMGLGKLEDLAAGRADIGLVAQQMQGVDPEQYPLLAEKAKRDAEWAAQAGSPEQIQQAPAQQPAQAPQEPTADARLKAAQDEAAEWKRKYGERESKLGEERRRTAERLARLEQAASAPASEYRPPTYTQPASYDPRIIDGLDPAAPVTAAQMAATLQSLASAFGQRLTVAQQEAIDAARSLQGYTLTANDEADLIDEHPWLAAMPRATQIQAMRAIHKPAATPAPATPRGVDMTELARARIRTASFIEPSSAASQSEQDAAAGVNSALAKKVAEYRAALKREGGSEDAERLINEINAMQRRRA